MPKIVIVTCDFDYAKDCFTCQESTPWEEVNESDLKILKSYLPYGNLKNWKPPKNSSCKKVY